MDLGGWLRSLDLEEYEAVSPRPSNPTVMAITIWLVRG
jgi:hypothetical protein